MTLRHWPDGNDPLASQLRAALDDAQLRRPDDVSLWRGFAAVNGRISGTRSRRWVWFASGVGSTAALAIVFALWLWPSRHDLLSRSPVSPWAAAEGQASVGAARAPSPNDAIKGATASRRLTLEGGVEAQLSATGVMHMEGADPRVDDGEVRFSVPKRPPGRPFVVHAGAYRVVVVGTRFGVSVHGAPGGGDGKRVAVDVDEGVVEVWGKSRLARLERGHRWDSSDAGPTEGPDRSAAQMTDAEVPAAGSAADPGARAELDRDRRRHRAKERALALDRVGGEVAPAAELPVAELTAAARAALATGDPAHALQIYRNLAQRTGPSAENAAYEVGKILGERMGQPAAAVAAWRRYRADYPHGILRVEADVSIIETLARSGEPEAALAEATDFLRRHPGSERRPEVARLAGDIHRTRGDCRRAAAAYQIALASPRPHPDTEAASYHRAACLDRLGDPGAGEAARQYLRTYPNGRFRKEAAALAGTGTGTEAPPTDGRTPRP